MTNFGTELRQVRKTFKIRIQTLAKRLGYSTPQYLYALEQGRVKASPKQVKQIASILCKMGAWHAKTDLNAAYLTDIEDYLYK